MTIENQDNQILDPGAEEFAIDEEGNLIVNGQVVGDFGPEPDNEPAAETGGDLETPPEPDMESEPEPESKPETHDAGEPEPEAKPDNQYTPEELDRTDFENVDIQRLPPELKEVYNRMRAGFGKKLETLSATRKSLEELVEELKAQREQFQRQAQQQPQQQQQPMDRASFARQISDYAKRQACQMLGISERDFDPFDTAHQSTLQLAVSQLYDSYKSQIAERQLQAEQQRRLEAEEQQRRQEFDGLIAEYQQKEPNFQSIYDYFPKWASSMPAYQRDEMQAEFAKGNIHGLRKWFDKCRADWYAQNKKPEPPLTEKSGGSKGEPTAGKPKVSASEFGAMSKDDQVEFLIKGGFVE